MIIKDGILIPSAADEGAVEEYLSARSVNTRKIREICSSKVERGLFGGVDKESLDGKLDEVVRLLTENELITAEIHGRGHGVELASVDGDKSLYVGHYLVDRLLDPKKRTGGDWWEW